MCTCLQLLIKHVYMSTIINKACVHVYIYTTLVLSVHCVIITTCTVHVHCMCIISVPIAIALVYFYVIIINF